MVYSKIKQVNLFILTQRMDSMRIIKSYLLNKMEGRKGNEEGVKKRKREKSYKMQ